MRLECLMLYDAYVPAQEVNMSSKKIAFIKNLAGNKDIKNVLTLSSSILYELKNYLAAMNVYAELSEDSVQEMRQKIRATNCLMDSMQLQIKSIFGKRATKQDSSFSRYFMSSNIKEALKQYPFTAEEKERLVVEVFNDFEYIGSILLTNHILYNLLTNSFRAIKKSGKGQILIKLDSISDKNFNKLIFKDTSSGIPKSTLSNMFELFSNKNAIYSSAGIGLAFCKMIMHSYKGSISCSSLEGEYTEFVLKFPRIP
jgi:signal transduction histidine kinase